MLKTNKIILIVCMMIGSFLYAYEPSVYSAGDINSATPYGLTKTEEAVLQNKKTLQMLYNKMTEQQRNIDGLSTIIEGQNREISELKEHLSTQERKNNESKEDNASYALLLEIGQTVDKINNNYVTREELSSSLGRAAMTTGSISTVNTVKRVDPADSYSQGVQLFGKGSYMAAKAHFEEALAINYKAAASNYYLGEIAYYTHKYQDAVSYFKTSSSLYDQASYMDILFLHTAISLEKNGDKEQAKGFYRYVIDTYPNKKSASIARKRI